MPKVQVLVRCRPALPHEEYKPRSKVEIDDQTNTVRVQSTSTNARVFSFDRVLPESENQGEVFEKILPMVDHALDGLHATIFAYGQTGSGKTHTMEGIEYIKDSHGRPRPNANTPAAKHGIVPRVIESIFERARLRMSTNSHIQYRISISFLQIYNEKVTDLLNPGVLKDGLKVRWTRSKFEVENLFHLECDTAEHMRELFFMGLKNKTMGSHAMNQQSSRSHCMFTIHVASYDPADRDSVVRSELTLVDLAGSEKLAMLAENPNDVLVRESIEINASLLALGKVITALASKTTSHVPYRDAKLTKLLQHSLGGNSMTTMIACISALDDYCDETMSTLLYAGRARNIKNDPVVNEDPRTALIRQLRAEIATLRLELSRYQQLCAGELLKPLSSASSAAPAAPRVGTDRGAVGLGAVDADTRQLADKLIASCDMLKGVIEANSQLRSAFDRLKTLKDEADQREFELQAENIALRERIEVLESIVLVSENDDPRREEVEQPRERVAVSASGTPSRPPQPAVRPERITHQKKSDQQVQLKAYSKKYRQPQITSSYSEYYGLAKKATEPSRHRQSQIVSEVETLLAKVGPATAAMVPLSLQSSGSYGSLAFGGTAADVDELEERRRRRAEKRAALEEQHRRMQQGLVPDPTVERPSSQQLTRRPTDHLFDYLSVSESASVFTADQLARLRERRGVGGTIPPPRRAADPSQMVKRETQTDAHYRKELQSAQTLVQSLNRHTRSM